MPDNNLLKPEVETDPDPMRVSTFAEPEYGKVTFYFGFELASGGRWPIYCKQLRISIPTGRKSSALTGDPQLISYSASAVHGIDQGRKWNIERNTNDPNKVVFTCTPDTITRRGSTVTGMSPGFGFWSPRTTSCCAARSVN